MKKADSLCSYKDKIEALRQEVYKLLKDNHVRSDVVIKLSRELDAAINSYYLTKEKGL